MRRIAFGSLLTAVLVVASAPATSLAHESTWVEQFGTTSNDGLGSGVAVRGRTVYVSGSTSGTLPDQTSSGGQDVYVRSYDSRGRIRWTRRFGTPGDDQARNGVLAAGPNLVVVGGSVVGALDGQTASGREDAFLRAYDRRGNELWTVQFGSAGVDFVRGVAIAKDGSIFASGQTRGQLQPPQQTVDGFVMRLARDGTVQWYKEIATPPHPSLGPRNDPTVKIAVTEEAVYVAGHTQGSFPGFTNAGGLDSFVARFTLDGDLEWVTQFGTPGDDFAWAVGVTGSTVFVAGHTNGAFPGALSEGDFDGFVAALGTDGQPKWIRQFGTSACEMLFSLATDRKGAVVVGQTGGLPVTCGGTDAQAFARRYDVEGNVDWTMEFGTPSADNLAAVALKRNHVYFAGITEGDLGGPNEGGQDAFVMRVRETRDDADDDNEENEEDDED
jgi:hypothetical protein